MKIIKLFETYISQKEIEKLVDECLLKVSKETYNYHDKYIWTEPINWRDVDYGAIENKYLYIEFNNKSMLDTNYIVEKFDGEYLYLKGFNEKFLFSDLIVKWSDKNKFIFKTLISISLPSSDGYTEIKKFIDEINLIIKFKVRNYSHEKGNIELFRGEENSKNIIMNLFYDETIFRELREDKITKGDSYTYKDIYFKIFYDFHKVMLHEMQHAYDSFRSKGKAFNKQFGNDYVDRLKNRDKMDISKEEDREFLNKLAIEYLNFPHEINARFTEAINKTTFIDLDFKDIEDGEIKVVEDMYPLEKVIKDFKNNFVGYEYLSEKDKKRLIRKVSQFWHLDKERISKG